jgi:hypothetical protein
MLKEAAVVSKDRTCEAEVQFSYNVKFPVSSGQFVAVAHGCSESPHFELVKEGKARFFELGKGCIVFHNYPDEAALKVLLEKKPELLDVLETLSVRFNNLHDLLVSLEKMSLIIGTWFFFHPRDDQEGPAWKQSPERNGAAASCFGYETTVSYDELARQQF